MRRTGSTALIAALVAALAGAAGAGATTSQALDRLAALQSPRTGAPTARGVSREEISAFAAWTTLAVITGGERPDAWRVGRRTLIAAIGRRPRRPIQRVARWALAMSAAGRLDDRDVRGLQAGLTADWGSDGRFGAGALDLGWALLAARAAAMEPPVLALDRLRSEQGSDGGWRSRPGLRADTVTTTTALQALTTWGEPRDSETVRRARRWLLRQQRRDGGFPVWRGRPSAAVETAWATLGIRALGDDPRSFTWRRRGGGGPLGYLRRLQRASGGVAATTGGRESVLATALTAIAFAGRPLPLEPTVSAVAASHAPRVIRRSPVDGGHPGEVVLVAYRDNPGGTGVDPGRVRFVVGGRDLTGAARVTPLGLQVATNRVGPRPATAVLLLTDRAGNSSRTVWTIGR
ncbi:MAG: prenyltransferase/squalene oxidase repeat-containing protein [Thermoleophilia bacterium]